jgi:hypothetical protein
MRVELVVELSSLVYIYLHLLICTCSNSCADTGIGMTPEELTTNLGTLAKSGTSDFLAKAESQDGIGNGNLIGSFGLGFYSSFLVADKVFVSSIPPKSSKYPNPTQHVFSSTADDSSFEIFPDPRGNTLGRGTEITLIMKDDASEYLDTTAITDLVYVSSNLSCQHALLTSRQQKQALFLLFRIPDLLVHSADGRSARRFRYGGTSLFPCCRSIRIARERQ